MNYPWSHLIDAAWPRFIAKVDARDPLGCWPWLGATSSGQYNTAPYGSFNVGDGYSVRSHIFMCEAAGITVPKGHHRDHLCVMSLCTNPLHFEPVTPRENSLRRWKSSPMWRMTDKGEIINKFDWRNDDR